MGALLVSETRLGVVLDLDETLVAALTQSSGRDRSQMLRERLGLAAPAAAPPPPAPAAGAAANAARHSSSWPPSRQTCACFVITRRTTPWSWEE